MCTGEEEKEVLVEEVERRRKKAAPLQTHCHAAGTLTSNTLVLENVAGRSEIYTCCQNNYEVSLLSSTASPPCKKYETK